MTPRRGALVLALAAATGACGPSRPRVPVVLVSFDTLRADHLGCYGYPRPTSPHIDRFRRDAVLFRWAFAHAPSTLQSHASILTSLRPPHHGASIAADLAVPPEVLTLAEVLRPRGYATASFNGGVQLDRAYGLDQGFDVYESARPRDSRSEDLVGGVDRFEHAVARARDFVLRAPGPGIFLFLHTYEVHHPYAPERRDLDLFRDGYRGPLPDAISVALLEDVNAGRRAVDDRDRAHVIAAYDAEIRSMDRAFGTFVTFLKEQGLYDDALVVVTSDHGEEFGEHGRLGWHSHTLYDEVLRVPLLVKLPGNRRADETVETLARGIDVAPTLLRALGVPVPPDFSGRDLLAPFSGPEEIWSGRDVPERRAVSSLRTPEWKLVGGRLYDLREDPAESVSVARERPGMVRRLKARRQAVVDARPRPARRHARVDDELRERLRSLGYLK